MLNYTVNRLRETLPLQWGWIDMEDARHHDTRRVVQTNMAEHGIAPHVAGMVLDHSVKGAPRSRAHYDMYHYVPEKREALTSPAALEYDRQRERGRRPQARLHLRAGGPTIASTSAW
jgi:hypothetical protein